MRCLWQQNGEPCSGCALCFQSFLGLKCQAFPLENWCPKRQPGLAYLQGNCLRRLPIGWASARRKAGRGERTWHLGDRLGWGDSQGMVHFEFLKERGLPRTHEDTPLEKWPALGHQHQVITFCLLSKLQKNKAEKNPPPGREGMTRRTVSPWTLSTDVGLQGGLGWQGEQLKMHLPKSTWFSVVHRK